MEWFLGKALHSVYGLLSSEACKEQRVVDSQEMPHLCPCLFKTYIVWDLAGSVLGPLEFIQWAGKGRSQSQLPAYQEPCRILSKNFMSVQNIFVKITLNFHWNFLFLKLISFWFSVKLSKKKKKFYKKLVFSTKIDSAFQAGSDRHRSIEYCLFWMAIRMVCMKVYRGASSASISSAHKMLVVYYIGESNAFMKCAGDKCSINIYSNRTELTLLFLRPF